MSETICAIATAIGGAIGIVRVSGDEAISATSKIFFPNNGKDFNSVANRVSTFGVIKDANGNIVDEVLAIAFRAPHSYTGEDSVELSCHGSKYILDKVIQLLISYGCRMARPGEYTQRAFVNGKMDLSQAESVADLVASRSAASHRVAMNQLRGGFKNKLLQLREKLLNITSLMELELDFSDHEDLQFADRTKLLQLAVDIDKEIEKLVNSFSIGNAIKSGIPVALVGETNVGKSTLLNALLSDNRAIVSDTAGTTRDTIEETFIIEGVEFRLIDTAGLRNTSDDIENQGINRTLKSIEKAQVVVWIVSAPEANNIKNETIGTFIERAAGKNLILAINKTDLLKDSDTSAASLTNGLTAKLQNCAIASQLQSMQVIAISAKKNEGIDKLKELMLKCSHSDSLNENDVIITNARHYEALSLALQAIKRVEQGLHSNLSADFVSQDLREIIYHLSDITGEVTADDVLGNIFSKFCVGK